MLPKLLLLVVIVFVVWYGMRFVTRLGQMRQVLRRAAEQAAMNARAAPPRAPALVAEDLVKCRVCASFVPAKGTTRCGRANCPY
jgi:uncharacterized protein